MKLRRTNKFCDFIKVRKNTKIMAEDINIKRLKKTLKIKSNKTFNKSRVSNVCKITGNRRAVHGRINLNRHFIRWKLDNNRYLDSWNYN